MYAMVYSICMGLNELQEAHSGLNDITIDLA